MDRKDFLDGIGTSATAFPLIYCIGCRKTDGRSSAEIADPTRLDFTLDLSLVANAALLINGRSLVSNGLIVARTGAGTYIAVQRSCTHGSYSLISQSANNRFYCLNHHTTFSENGSVTNGQASRSLTVYNTQLTGTTLKIYS